MTQTREQTLHTILACGVVAVIRANSSERLPDVARALLAGGVTNVEVTMTTPGAIAAIGRLADALGDRAVLGVGTVLDAATCRDAISAGARFVVSPHFDPHVVEATLGLDRVSVPGAFTPTEILRAAAAGADLVKVFPSGAVGPSYFRDVLAPLPHLRLIPTGGVTPANAGEWIKAGAACVGAGSTLIPPDALANGDWAAITDRARTFVDAVRAARGK
jgi:2-dehydro-3-deoxyphosphogluconate aldolase/(4S)-4-hydroxy-2-oxoglutarate aldolase